MPSPFPGMDPYLEAHWGDVRTRLVLYSSDQLRGQLPPELRARVEERVFVETEDGPTRVIVPDIRVIERPYFESHRAAQKQTSGSIAVAEPLERLDAHWADVLLREKAWRS